MILVFINLTRSVHSVCSVVSFCSALIFCYHESHISANKWRCNQVRALHLNPFLKYSLSKWSTGKHYAENRLKNAHRRIKHDRKPATFEHCYLTLYRQVGAMYLFAQLSDDISSSTVSASTILLRTWQCLLQGHVHMCPCAINDCVSAYSSGLPYSLMSAGFGSLNGILGGVRGLLSNPISGTGCGLAIVSLVWVRVKVAITSC